MQESNVDRSIVPVPTARDVSSDVLRQGGQRLLAQAIDADVAEWIDQREELKGLDGRRLVVRNGYLPTRTIHSGIGPVEVTRPRRASHRRTRPRVERYFGVAGIAPLRLIAPSAVRAIPQA